MSRPALPPYFAQVGVIAAVVVAVACGAAHLLAPVTPQQDADSIQEIAPNVPADGEDIDIEPPEPVPAQVTLPLKGTEYPLVVGGSSLTEAQMRHRLHAFRRTILSIEQGGHAAGIVIRDMGTGAYLAYAPDRDLYPASSIKGPYVISVYERLVDTGQARADQVRPLAQSIILYSDNDAYSSLSSLCGRQAFADWAADCRAVRRGGVRYNQFATYRYTMLRPRQLARMWQHSFAYLNSGSAGARELAGFFEQREVSPIRAGLPDATLTLTKAGWYPLDNGPLYGATVDAGIVVSGGHSYVVVIMTSIPDDLDGLAQLVPGIFSATAVLQ